MNNFAHALNCMAWLPLFTAPVLAQTPSDTNPPRVEKMQDDAVHTRLARARSLLRVEGDYATAERELRSIVREDPGKRVVAMAKLLLAELCRDLGRADEAQELVAALRADESTDETLRAQVAALLSQQGGSSGIEVRVRQEVSRLFSEDKATRLAAHENLRFLGAEAKPTLFELLKERTANPTEFERILELILGGGGDVALQAIEVYHKHEDPTLRKALINAVRSIADFAGDERALAESEKLFEDPDPRVREFAMQKMQHSLFGYRHVLAALSDPASSVRLAAVPHLQYALKFDHKGAEATKQAYLARLSDLCAAPDGEFSSKVLSQGSALLTAIVSDRSGMLWFLDHVEWFPDRTPVGSPELRFGTFADFNAAIDKRDPETKKRIGDLGNDYFLPLCTKDNLANYLELARATGSTKLVAAAQSHCGRDNVDVWMPYGDLSANPSFVPEGMSRPVIVWPLCTTVAGFSNDDRWNRGLTEMVIEWTKRDDFEDKGRSRLVYQLGKAGDLEAVTPALVVSWGPRFHTWWFEALGTRRVEEVPVGLSEQALLEPSQLGVGTRNTLLAMAILNGARDIAELCARSYSRGLAGSQALSLEGATKVHRGLEWVFLDVDAPRSRTIGLAEQAATIRACLAAARQSRSTEVIQAIYEDLRSCVLQAHVESRVTDGILDDVESHEGDSVSYWTLDSIVARQPDNERAIKLANRLLSKDATRQEYLERCAARSAYVDGALASFDYFAERGGNSRSGQWLLPCLASGGANVATRMVEALRHDAPNVREMAVHVLGRFPRSDEALRVVDLVHDPDTRVRLAVANACQNIQRIEIAPKLLVLLEDVDSKVRASAQKALEDLRFLENQRSHWKDWLERRGEPTASMALLKRAEDPKRSKEARLAAIRGLGLIGDADALPFLIDLLENEDADVRAAAKESIDRLESKR
ncbi:MAG: HEAT repeat domain-containing protein [Planctomycetes bacterium]|nr:HEAT repeat domain-containing protein [Planctomycetota bacterium]MCB9919403.1 HEAT repeat domain-containing protein [Planctomycetota bacterium]